MSEEKTKKVAKKKASKKVQTKRVYRGEQEVDHDLFVLNETQTRKCVNAYQKPKDLRVTEWGGALWEPINHKHFFHSVNSDGKVQKYSCSTGGHCHEIIVEENEHGELIAKCGPPVVKVKGKMYPYTNDKHTHDVEYRLSDKIQVRVKNKDFLKYQANAQQEEREINNINL